MAISEVDLEAARGCDVDKDSPKARCRRLTGGMQTITLQCGLLVDWRELYRGESLQLVYASLLTVAPS